MSKSIFIRSHRLLSVSVMALLVASPSLAFAQSLSGKITDASGQASFEGAIVNLDGINRSATTDRFGQYRINNVPAGTYNVTVTYIGAAARRSTISIPAEGAELDLVIGDDVDYIDNIIVVGTRAAQASALNKQRASGSIISIIDSDGLGNFPDTTVADSLSRVAGLSIETDQGEGRYVSIRGINTDLISSSINGVRTPSPEDRRGVLLDGVPSDLLDGIEVQKSLTPNVDADSLGGVVNLKTVSAFDRKGQYLRAKVEGRYNVITEEISPKATLTYSNVFNDKLGVAISGNFQSLAIESHNNEAGGSGVEDGEFFFMNDDYEQRWYDLTRERLGLVANFDYDLNDMTRLYLRTLYNDYKDDEVRNKFEYKDLDDAEAATSANAFILPINEVDAEVRKREEVRSIQTYALGGLTQMDAWTFDYEVAYAFAEEDDSSNHDATFRFEDIQDLNVGDLTFDTSTPQTPIISGDAALAAIFDPSNYILDVFEQENTVNDDTEISAKFDVTKDGMLGVTPVTWQAGIKLRDREKNRDVNLQVYEGIDDISLSDYTDGLFIDNWRLGNPMPAFPDADLTTALRNNALGTLELNEDDTNFASISEDFTINEQILAAYVMGTFDFGQLSVIAGGRFEQTNVDMTGYNYVEEAVIDDAQAIFYSDDYLDFLPSVNVKFDFNDKLIGRAAYYAAIVRPSFGDMAPFARLNDDEDEAEIGNPALDPYEANNFDLSLEYYPTELSVLSAGLFYKQIDNPIYQTTFDIENLPASVDLSSLTDGQRLTVEEITTSINVDSVELIGMEFNYVQDLSVYSDMLDGFLVSANLTLTDSEATIPGDDGERIVPFLKQSDTVWNAALGYDKGPWDLRISANFRGDYLRDLDEGNGDSYADDRTLIEASAKYDVSDQFQVYLEGKNLTDAPEYYYFGDEQRLSQYDEFGSTYIFGLRYTY